MLPNGYVIRFIWYDGKLCFSSESEILMTPVNFADMMVRNLRIKSYMGMYINLG